MALRMSVGLALAVTATCAALATTASAETVPYPAGAAAGSAQSSALTATTCPAAGDCVAVGTYLDGAGDQQGLVESEAGGNWSPAEMDLAGLVTTPNPEVLPDSLACTSAQDCVAVGTFSDQGAHQQGLIYTQTEGIWTASEAPLPYDASGDPDVQLNSVACPSRSQCVAAGSYTDTAGHQQGLIESYWDGSWDPGRVDLSGLDASGSPQVELNQVACAGEMSCVAVGDYQSAASGIQPLVLTMQVNGSWQAGDPGLPFSTAGTGQDAVLEAVACPAAGSCTAVGYYTPGATSYAGLLETQSAGSWQPNVAFLPASSSSDQQDLTLNAVSCAAAGDCTAVGAYDADAADDVQAWTVSERAGDWRAGSELSMPAQAGDPNSWLTSVACMSDSDCLAAGSYDGSDGQAQTLVARLNGYSSPANVQQLATYDTTGPAPYTYYSAAAACSADAYCAVAGGALNGPDGDMVPYLLNAPGAPTDPSVTAKGTAATLRWTDPADTGGLPLTGYQITPHDLTDPASSSSVSQSAGSGEGSVIGLNPADTYRFTVSAQSLLGTGISEFTPSVAVPASKPQLLTSLKPLFAPSGRAARLTAMRRTHTYTFTYHPLESGLVKVRWYQYATSGVDLVAAATVLTKGRRVAKVHVRLTALGRRLVRSHRRLRVIATASFRSSDSFVTTTHRFTLR